MAHHLAMTPANYQKLEKGTISLSIERFLKICAILDINPAKVLTDACASSHPSLFTKSVVNQGTTLVELTNLRKQNELMTKLMNITIANIEAIHNSEKPSI